MQKKFVEDSNGELDLQQVLKMLADQGITRLMVEGGPKVAASFVAGGLIDEAALLRGEKSIGADGINPLEGMPLGALTGNMTSHGTEKLGADVIESFART